MYRIGVGQSKKEGGGEEGAKHFVKLAYNYFYYLSLKF